MLFNKKILGVMFGLLCLFGTSASYADQNTDYCEAFLKGLIIFTR